MALPKELVVKLKEQLVVIEKGIEEADDTLRRFEVQDIPFEKARKSLDENKDLVRRIKIAIGE